MSLLLIHLSRPSTLLASFFDWLITSFTHWLPHALNHSFVTYCCFRCIGFHFLRYDMLHYITEDLYHLHYYLDWQFAFSLPIKLHYITLFLTYIPTFTEWQVAVTLPLKYCRPYILRLRYHYDLHPVTITRPISFTLFLVICFTLPLDDRLHYTVVNTAICFLTVVLESSCSAYCICSEVPVYYSDISRSISTVTTSASFSTVYGVSVPTPPPPSYEEAVKEPASNTGHPILTAAVWPASLFATVSCPGHYNPDFESLPLFALRLPQAIIMDHSKL